MTSSASTLVIAAITADGAHAIIADASANRAFCSDFSMPSTSGCAPPSARRAVRSVFLECRHGLAEIVERGVCSLCNECPRVDHFILSVSSLLSPENAQRHGHMSVHAKIVLASLKRREVERHAA